MGNLLNMSGGSLLKVPAGSILPAGYRVLEYIESTGTQYVDTGIKVGSSIRFDFKAYVDRNTLRVFGGRAAVNNKQLCLFNSDVGGYLDWRWNNYRNTAPYIEGIYTFSNLLYHGQLDVLSASKQIALGGDYEETFSTNFNIFLFAINSGGGVEYSGGCKMYYAKFYDNGTLVRNFIPCKNPNNVVGMYDTVNDVFYSSPNGAAFVAGPEV